MPIVLTHPLVIMTIWLFYLLTGNNIGLISAKNEDLFIMSSTFPLLTISIASLASNSHTTDKTRAANQICMERKKKPACLDGKQAGGIIAWQMCRELNRQIELSGYRKSEMGLTGQRLERDWKIRRFRTAALIREIALLVSVGLVSPTAFPFRIAMSRQFPMSLLYQDVRSRIYPLISILSHILPLATLNIIYIEVCVIT